MLVRGLNSGRKRRENSYPYLVMAGFKGEATGASAKQKKYPQVLLRYFLL
jgi:hypothetical protein